MKSFVLSKAIYYTAVRILCATMLPHSNHAPAARPYPCSKRESAETSISLSSGLNCQHWCFRDASDRSVLAGFWAEGRLHVTPVPNNWIEVFLCAFWKHAAWIGHAQPNFL